MKNFRMCIMSLMAISFFFACNQSNNKKNTQRTDDDGFIALSDEQVENIVSRSYQYVAMYNVNNKLAIKQGGWNTALADTALKDHTLREIARPNNDTYYTTCFLDLRQDPIIIDVPAFYSKYASLLVSGYDHYVSMPIVSRLGDYKKPEKILLYTSRTEGYDGAKIKGIDRYFEASGDFVQATFRVMPHLNEPKRYKRIVNQMQSVKITPLAEYLGENTKPMKEIDFPAVGETDADIFENNLLEVMQFVFNHTTFDPSNAEDQAILEAYKPLGVEPGKIYKPENAVKINGKHFREKSEQIQKEWLSNLTNKDIIDKIQPWIFQPKGKTNLEALLAVSIIGPIGVPREENVYPQVVAADGEPINAMNDYVIRMTKDELPPAKAFWSLTLYDLDQGFFIPNDRKKYSVGENGGMKLNSDGGIDIYVAAEKPEGVPEENWLPIARKDMGLSFMMRVYAPDLEKYKTWKAPKAEKL